MNFEMITLDYGGRGGVLEDDYVINIPKFFKEITIFYSEFDQFRNEKLLFSTKCLICYDM